MGTRPATTPFRDPRVLTTLVGVAIAIFMGALENLVISTASPTLVAELHGIEIFSWTSSAYILAATVTTPIWGKVADIFGHRPAMFGGLALFITGSALAGMSQSMPQLIAFRVIQGLGAAALFPVGMTIVARLLTLEQRAKVVGLFSGMWGLASLVGPTIGGYLTEFTELKWRACFLIIIPFGLISAAMIGAAYRDEHQRRDDISFDYWGTIVLSAALILLSITIERSTRFPMIANFAALMVCCALLYLFAQIEIRNQEPLVPLEIFRSRIVLVATLHGLFAMMALLGTMYFLPLFVQGVIGTSAVGAGNTLTPFIISWVLTSIVAGRGLLRFGYKPLVMAGMAVMLLGSSLLAMVSTNTSRLTLSLDTILMGIGGGLVTVTLMIAAQHGVARNQLGITTSTVQFARNIGAAIGTAAMGAIMYGRLQYHLSHAPAELHNLFSHENFSSIVDPKLRVNLSENAAKFLVNALADGISSAFKFVLFAALIGTIIAFFVPKGYADELAYKENSSDTGDLESENNPQEELFVSAKGDRLHSFPLSSRK